MWLYNLILNKVPKDFGSAIFFDFISKIFSIVIALLVIRFTSITDYAEYTIFNSISIFLLGLFGNGIALAYVRYYVEQKSRQNGKHNGLYSNVLSMIIFLFLSLLLIFIFFELLIDIPTIYYFALFFGLLLSLGNLNQAFFQANKKFDMSGMVNNIRNIILLFFLIIFLAFNKSYDIKILISVFIISSVLSLIVGIILVFKHGERAPTKDKTIFKGMLLESFWLILYSFLLNLFNQIDIFMLKAMTDDYTLAQYGVAYKYYGIALSLLPILQNVLRVKTSDKDIIDDINLQRQFTINWIKKATPISFVFVILSISLSGQVMPILNSTSYDSAISLFNILMIGVGISYITAPNVGVMMASGKHKLMSAFAFIAFLVNILGNYYFIPTHGAYAATITTIISQAFINISCTVTVIFQKKK